MIKYSVFIIFNIIDLGAETPADPEYKRFLENYSCDEEKSMANPETLLGEIEAKTRELIGTAPSAQRMVFCQTLLKPSRYKCV